MAFRPHFFFSFLFLRNSNLSFYTTVLIIPCHARDLRLIETTQNSRLPKLVEIIQSVDDFLLKSEFEPSNISRIYRDSLSLF